VPGGGLANCDLCTSGLWHNGAGSLLLARIVSLIKGRSIVSVYPEGIEVIIPAKKSLFVNCFLAFWLLAWAYGEAVIISRLLSIDGQTPDAYIVFFCLRMDLQWNARISGMAMEQQGSGNYQNW